VVGGQDEGVGQIVTVFDDSSAGVTPDEGLIFCNERRLLKITEGEAGSGPAIDAENGLEDVAEEGFVDRHIFSGGRFSVLDQADQGGG
jgi:hypothetical protein